jgi:DNA polymerase-1
MPVAGTGVAADMSVAWESMPAMTERVRVGVAPAGGDAAGWRLTSWPDDASPAGPPAPGTSAPGTAIDLRVTDLAPAVADLERRLAPRWVWADTAAVYPALLRAGVRVARCHDVATTELLLRTHAGERVHDHRLAAPVPDRQPALFGAPDLAPAHEPPDLHVTDAGQRDAVARARATSPGFGLLVAAESAATLAAAEMTHAGLPWRDAEHDRVLVAALGPRPRHGGRPPRLQELADAVGEALGVPAINPDSQPAVLAALRRAGVPVGTLRAHELKRHDHPAIEPLLRYKELARLHAAHCWHWREQWVRDGRFHPEYVPGGVVSGRWATRGGGALQIPRAVRSAVVADAGRVLVVADAGQLEPRVLAALAGDPGMVAATGEGDLYASIARQALGRPEARDEAKIALLSAMYGGGAGSPALAALRRRFPLALSLLEDAARTGEDGGIVRSVLGRTCPPPRPGWQDVPDEVAAARGRARGRFTRNFVVQASAADWANVLVATLRTRLAELTSAAGDGKDAGAAELVFFQHDEVIVHVREDLAGDVVAAVTAAGADATRLVLGDRGVRVPLDAVVAASYAAKGGAPDEEDPPADDE